MKVSLFQPVVGVFTAPLTDALPNSQTNFILVRMNRGIQLLAGVSPHQAEVACAQGLIGRQPRFVLR